MNQHRPPPPSTTFADFMYAVVVGVAFSDIKLTDPLQILFPTIFLLVVVIEDFFLYQTQVKPHTDIFSFTSFSSLVLEVSILLAWFLSFLSRKDAREWAFACFSAFLLLKWIASVKHIGSELPASKRWVIHRDHLFLISAIVSAVLIFVHPAAIVVSGTVAIPGDWTILALAWLVQMWLWWAVVGHFNRSNGGV